MTELILLVVIGVLVIGAGVAYVLLSKAGKEKDIDNTPRGDREYLYNGTEKEDDYSENKEQELEDQDKYYENKAKLANDIKEISKTHQKESDKEKEDEFEI